MSLRMFIGQNKADKDSHNYSLYNCEGNITSINPDTGEFAFEITALDTSFEEAGIKLTLDPALIENDSLKVYWERNSISADVDYSYLRLWDDNDGTEILEHLGIWRETDDPSSGDVTKSIGEHGAIAIGLTVRYAQVGHIITGVLRYEEL